MDCDRLIVVVVGCLIGLAILTVGSCDIICTTSAFEHGYTRRSLPGYSEPQWVKSTPTEKES